jgi:hypothetical protein
MRKMWVRKTIGVWLILTLSCVFITGAQGQSCEIDLSDAAAQLMRAQAAAAGGDADAGLAQIAEVRAALATITTGCAETGIEAGVLLENQLIVPNGSFAFDYPSGWVTGTFSPSPGGGGMFVGSSTPAVQALNTNVPQMQSGQQALVVAVGTPELLGADDETSSLETVLTSFASRALVQYELVGELELSTMGDETIGRMAFSGETFEAVLVGRQIDDDLYAIVVGVSAPGELDALRPTADAVALSVR